MNAKKLSFLAASVISLAATGAQAGVKVTKDKSGNKWYCQNNQCKGNSACGGAGNKNGCSGQNTCKGKGWLDVSNKKDCEAEGKGKWVKLRKSSKK